MVLGFVVVYWGLKFLSLCRYVKVWEVEVGMFEKGSYERGEVLSGFFV